jgi:hypothetical protein
LVAAGVAFKGSIADQPSEAPMKNTLIAYAYLKTSFDNGATSPLEILDKVVLRSLLTENNGIDIASTKVKVKKFWGIDVPISVLQHNINRLIGKGYLKRHKIGNDNRYSIDITQVERDDIRSRERSARAQYERIKNKISSVLLSIGNPYKLESDEIIEKWLDHSAISFLGGQAEAKFASEEDREVNRVVAIAGRIPDDQHDEEFLSDLGQLCLGDVLYRTVREITSSDLEENSLEGTLISLPMSRVDVYLDVGIIFRYFGYFGAQHATAARELLLMAKQTGCNLKIFTHTLEEFSEGIIAVAEKIRSHPSRVYGPILTYAIENGSSASDLFEEAANALQRINSIDVAVADKPKPDIPLNLNEVLLDYMIEIGVKQDNDLARKRDVDSLAGIFRLRQGNKKDKLEDCNAIFVTHNKSLSDAAHKYFRKHFKEEGIINIVQLCMTDVVFATRLWTKLPTGINWIPRNQIISFTLGNLIPSNAVRERFLSKLRELARNSKITDDEMLRVQYSRFTDQILAQNYRNPDDIEEEQVKNALTAVIDKERAKLNARVEEGRLEGIAESEKVFKQLQAQAHQDDSFEKQRTEERLTLLHTEIALATERAALAEAQHVRVVKMSGSLVKYVVKTLGIVITGVIFYGVLFGIFQSIGVSWTSWQRIIFASTTIILTIFTWYGLSWTRFERYVFRVIFSKIYRKFLVNSRKI